MSELTPEKLAELQHAARVASLPCLITDDECGCIRFALERFRDALTPLDSIALLDMLVAKDAEIRRLRGVITRAVTCINKCLDEDSGEWDVCNCNRGALELLEGES